MKRMLILFALLTPAAVDAQDLYVWMVLSGDRVLVNASWAGMDGDSIRVLRAGKPVVIQVGEVEQIRLMREGSIMEGAVVGAGIGLAAGAATGVLTRPSDDRHGTLAISALTMSLIGGIVGSVAGSLGDMEQAAVLTGRTPAEKQEIIRSLVEAF